MTNLERIAAAAFAPPKAKKMPASHNPVAWRIMLNRARTAGNPHREHVPIRQQLTR